MKTVSYYSLLMNTGLNRTTYHFTSRKVAVDYIRKNWPQLDIHQDEDPADDSWLSVFHDNIVPPRGTDADPFIYGLPGLLNIFEEEDI